MVKFRSDEAGEQYLSQGFSVGAHVGEDDENVLLTLVSEELCGGEGETRRDDALDGGVIGEVQEQADVLHGPVLLCGATDNGIVSLA